jgi:SAM-dependent methyltransferase
MDEKTDWWENFFDGLWLTAQRQAWPEEKTKSEVDFIEKLFLPLSEYKILDVPCGTGRHSIELARRGHKVTGIDITELFLLDGEKIASQEHLNIIFEKRDMRDLPWEEEFDGVICLWGSFGFFDERGNREFLKSVSRNLKPGGKFLMDLHITETLIPHFQPRGWSRMGEILLIEERHYDHINSRVNTEWILADNGKMEKRELSIRIYTYREICELLYEAGFIICEGYSSLNMEPFKFGSKRLYMVGTKGD